VTIINSQIMSMSENFMIFLTYSSFLQLVTMWKAAAGQKPPIAGAKPVLAPKPVNVAAKDPDDWDTDPDFVNDVSEKEQRWGAKTVADSGHVGSVNINKLRQEVTHFSHSHFVFNAYT
jgi:hypothetical protein